MADGAAGGTDGELASGNQGGRGLVNEDAVDVDDEDMSVVVEYRSVDESVESRVDSYDSMMSDS